MGIELTHIYIYIYIGGFPKFRGTIMGVAPKVRTIVFWGLYWGPLIVGNYQYVPMQCPYIRIYIYIYISIYTYIDI